MSGGFGGRSGRIVVTSGPVVLPEAARETGRKVLFPAEAPGGLSRRRGGRHREALLCSELH